MANHYLVDVVPKRIIARLDVKNGRVVKGVMMEGVQSVGDPLELSQRYYTQGADEVVLLDTVASLYKRLELPDIISEIVKGVFVPVCAGGGVTSCHDAEKLFYSGADKVCVNTGALRNPELLKELSCEFGSQSIVLQLDGRFLNGKCRIFYNTGRDLSEICAAEWLRIAQDQGIGEVLVTSIEKDGTGKGPDINLINFVQEHVRVPIIYGGGVSDSGHVEEVLSCESVSGAVLASYLHVQNANIATIKASLQHSDILIREDTVI